MKYQLQMLAALLTSAMLLGLTGSGFAEYTDKGNGKYNQQGGKPCKLEEWKKNHPNGKKYMEQHPEAKEKMKAHQQKREEWMKNHPEAQQKKAEYQKKREEWLKNHPEARQKMGEHQQKREEWMKNHPEAQAKMAEHQKKREEWLKNHPEAAEAMKRRYENGGPGRGSSGDIPGNAYGNNQTRGNGGQMGNSRSPHRD
jgi:hypothetical protein